MPTARQKKVARLIVENATLDKPLNGGQMLEKVRYGKISKQPHRILESEGVLEELKNLGFTEENAKSVVTEIMLNTDEDASARLKATDQVFKVTGSYAPEKSQSLTVNVDAKVENSDLEAIRQKFESDLKQQLANS